MKTLITCFFLLLNIATYQLTAAPFNVRDYGATGDGKTLDTDAINRAIEAAASAGGGTVEFPAGDYLSFSIHLRSNVTLFLDAGATIEGAEPPEDLSYGYDAPEPNPITDQYADFGHTHWRNSLIWGENLENIGIIGPGRIYGRGLSRGRGRRDLTPEERPAWRAQSDYRKRIPFPLPDSALEAIAAQESGPFGYPGRDTLPAGVGNKALALKLCKNVLIRDVTIFHGGHFAILATGCDNMTIDNVTIDTNRDGIDLDCSRNTTVSNCRVNSPYDDAICPKSSYALGEARITENLTIVNCQVSGFEEGTLLDGTMQPSRKPTGRIKFGTEASGGFRNCVVSNCTFRASRGLALEQVDGGILENISISNITMMDVHDYAIYLTLGKRNRTPNVTTTSRMRNILISNIIADGGSDFGAIQIMGLPEQPIEGVRLQNIRVTVTGGGTKEDAAIDPPELGEGYPEPYKMGTLPAYGLFARHVRDLELADIRLSYQSEDQRPAAIFTDVETLDIDNFKPQATHGVQPVVFASDVSDLTIRNSPLLTDNTK